jgi:hypothetical protein
MLDYPVLSHYEKFVSNSHIDSLCHNEALLRETLRAELNKWAHESNLGFADAQAVASLAFVRLVASILAEGTPHELFLEGAEMFKKHLIEHGDMIIAERNRRDASSE